MAGTSIASPHVAGVYALLKQAHPDWTAAEARSALMTTASRSVRDNDRMTRADPFEMGAGQSVRAVAGASGSIAQPGLVYDAGLFQYAAFTCGMGWGVFTPGQMRRSSTTRACRPRRPTSTYRRSASPRCPVAEPCGGRSRALPVARPRHLPGTSPGTARVQHQGVAVHAAVAQRPDGDVQRHRHERRRRSRCVAVRRADLAGGRLRRAQPHRGPGHAVRGAWRGRRDRRERIARDPSAVRLRGRYRRTPHGLVGATVTHGDVHQDPDQVFDPSDAGAAARTSTSSPSTTRHISASRYRPARPPPERISICTWSIRRVTRSRRVRPEGRTSWPTSPTLPNGTWQVYVHGFSTSGGIADYDLFTWSVPNAAGGSLSITSAPKRARMARDGTVEVAWTDLATGAISDWYLGLVTHRGPDGELARTIISVDDRHRPPDT